MQTCPSCKNELSERGFHCPACGMHVRCKACREILDLDARFCVTCGAAVGETSPPHLRSNSDSTTGPAYNVIEFEEDMRSRRFRAKVTDQAIDSVSNPLTLFLARRMGVQVKQSRRHPRDSGIDMDDLQLDLPGIDPEAEGENPAQDGSLANARPRQALPATTEVEQLKEIFHSAADKKLKLDNPRLKQHSQRDFVERLSVLFLYTHELTGSETIPRIHLNEVLSDAKVYDGNARKWIANTDLLSHDGDSIGLSVPGRKRAKEVLRQMHDPQSNTTWLLGSRTSTRASKPGIRDAEDAKQTGSEVSRGRRPRGTSYSAQVRKLVNDGFLKEGRTGKQVQVELERRGHKFALSHVNFALVQLTKNERLSRQENEQSEWVYHNR
jgi:predicted RNA-binding Zn-ribbon protein involved in translation (DUF1610 family)